MAICCFTGHNMMYAKSINDRIYKECENLILVHGVTEFWVGNYGGFDNVSARVVRILKTIHKNIELNLIIPYITKEINKNHDLYYRNFDNIIIADMPENTPKRIKIIKSNQFMIDSSQYIICYVENTWGGAARTYDYAQNKKHLKIINIAT